MLTVILGFIIGAVLSCIIAAIFNKEWLIDVFLIIFVILSFVISLKIDSGQQMLSKTTYLQAIGDNISTTGHFFLGGGSIDSELYYFYYTKEGNGFVGNKIHASNTIIYETDRKEPQIVSFTPVTKNWLLRLFSLQIVQDGHRKTEIYIPKGSILQNYKFDLKN